MLRRRAVLAPTMLLSMVLIGCSDSDTLVLGDGTPAGGNEPLTPRALAAVVAEYTGAPVSATTGYDMEETGKGLIAAVEMQFTGDPGTQLAVGVGEDLKMFPTTCADATTQDENISGCEEVQDGVLFWQDVEPHEDPGVVYLAMSMADTDVVFFQSGPDIDKDPRELDLPVSVDKMMAIAGDPRVDVTTSQAAVEAGQDLPFWRD